MSLELVIVTPEGEAFSGTVDQVILPGSEGDFGVLEKHERFLAPLKHGALEMRTGGTSHWAAISNGFADVSGERVVVLADFCARADEIDAAGVENERQIAQTELDSLPETAENEARRLELHEMLLHATIRMTVSERA
jgi:F-type H+-transporting ATPase subunit epsilon